MSTASDYIESRITLSPRVVVVLGSGLGGFTDAIERQAVLPYDEIPGWPRATAEGHAGKLIVGLLEGVPIAAFSGRVHLYEGYTARQAVFSLRTLRRFNVDAVILTNAAGGIKPTYQPGQLVLISDHINLMGQNPLTGANDRTLGPRFPDMSEAYSKKYRELARDAGREMGLDLEEGVYAGLPGPSYETPAEIRFLKAIGADLVGMSTVPETIAANHMRMKVLGISCVTNLAAGVTDRKLNHEEVLETGERTGRTLTDLLRRVIPNLIKP
jgi:purine-nucleoside phosphorylase